MALKDNIYKLRTKSRLSQAEFAELFNVSHQSVQKWESGQSKPTLDMLIQISKAFHVSVDALLFDNNARVGDENLKNREIYPSYASSSSWDFYSEALDTEYEQLIDEGADVASFKELFESVEKMPCGKYKARISDVLFEIGLTSLQRKNFAYHEPSDLEAIQTLRKSAFAKRKLPPSEKLREKIAGAWYGRICGCLLGKPIEGIRTNELRLLLNRSGNYPLHRYILRSDITEEMVQQFDFPLLSMGGFTDTITCAPADDDTNYTVLYQEIIEKYGREFTPFDVSRAWIAYQSKNAYCTAERVAFRNFVAGYNPPDSAVYQNPFREWIGAQIRGDYFGYINPGNPEMAAEMAWRDACISHTKNGIYGEMFVSAMLACAAVCDDMTEIIEGGLSQIPATSRLYEAIQNLLSQYRAGVSENKAFKDIHTRWNEFNQHHWCHTISNAEIVTAALLYGGGQYEKSICIAVQTGFDTDCNGATVGSILGMKNGLGSIPKAWLAPIHGKLDTSIFGVGRVNLDDAIDKTMKHIGS